MKKIVSIYLSNSIVRSYHFEFQTYHDIYIFYQYSVPQKRVFWFTAFIESEYESKYLVYVSSQQYLLFLLKYFLIRRNYNCRWILLWLKLKLLLYFTFPIGEVLEEDQNFLEDSVQDEKTKKRKIARALQILHIRQSKFQSLCDASRHDKVKV